jgi:hypothetical protein
MMSNDPVTEGAIVDGALIEEALSFIQDARARAPSDFLLALAVIVGP